MKTINMLFRILFFSLICCSVQAEGGLDYQSIWNCDEDKFHWYCDLEKDEKQKEEPKASSAGLEIKDIKTAEELRKELKRREDIAIMEPTEKNVKDYVALWQHTQEKGSVFADSWRRVVWQNPELDYALKRPANNTAIKMYDAQRTENEAQQLKKLAKEHGLIFFFKSNCPYCHAMAPTLKMLANRYGIEVLGVSLDGRGIQEFPNPRNGQAQAAAWGVERVPALFIGSKINGDHAPIGFGMMSLSEIVNRIFVLTGTKPGDNF